MAVVSSTVSANKERISWGHMSRELDFITVFLNRLHSVLYTYCDGGPLVLKTIVKTTTKRMIHLTFVNPFVKLGEWMPLIVLPQ